jgi:5-methylcytosine-specific restriction endonuclease McrA
VSAPTEHIPAKARALIAARDRGCRFPGCRMPIGFTDVHHVVPREHGGHTIVTNLVALCRRHHTAVHEGGWKLHLHTDATVTVKRGRIVHTSDPP